jgi:hypothetical protein
MALVGWWPLDGNTNDYSVNNNTGVNTNVTFVNGKIGQAGSFNGISSTVIIPLLSFDNEFSYALWVNTSNTTDTRMFFGGNLNTNSSIKYGFLGGNFFIRVISSNQQVTIPNISNIWAHIVIRRNSDNKIDLFINGVGQRLFSDAAQSGTTFLNIIGNVSDGSSQRFLGSLNDVRIYNHALSQKEINELAKAKVLHYVFNKDESIVYDNSGYGRNGTKVNSPTFVEGKLGSGSYRFADISKYIQAPYGLGINPSTNGYTFSIWIKITSTANQMFFHTPNGSSQRFYIGINSGKWDMGIQGVAWGTGVTTAVNNQWSHIVVTMSGGFAKMYVNGIYSFQKTYTSYTFPDNLRIGSRSDYITSDSLDDVRIYATALSEADILDLYQTRAKIDNQGNLYANEFVEDYEVASSLTLNQLFGNNKVLNGNFTNGLTSWTTGSNLTNVSVLNGILTFTGSGAPSSTINNWFQQPNVYLLNNTYYRVIKYKTGATGTYYFTNGYTNTTIQISTEFSINTSTFVPSSGPGFSFDRLALAATSGSVFTVDYIEVYNLTEIFGAGNEPTLTQMDAWYRDYSQSRTKSNGQIITNEFSEVDSPSQEMKIFRDKIQIQGSLNEGGQ